MRPRRVVAPDEAQAIFDQAVREHALVVISLQEGDDWLTFKSRFLERDPSHRFFVLDYQANDQTPLPTLAAGQYTGISFRHKSRKIMFSTVVEAKGRYVLDDKTAVSAIRYRWPQTMTELQRRAYYRTRVPSGTPVVANIWAGGASAWATAQQKTLQITTGQLVDMSCGGCLVSVNTPDLPNWPTNATLGVELALPDGRPPIIVNANYRGGRRENSGNSSVAVQFVGLEMSVDGRVILQRLATNIQKFHRLAASADARQQQKGWGL